MITNGSNRVNVSSKIGNMGENFPVRLEAITVKVDTIIVSSVIKRREWFTMRYSFQKLWRNFHCPRVSPLNVGRVRFLKQASKNPITCTNSSSEGNLGIAKIETLTWVLLECISIMRRCELGTYDRSLLFRSFPKIPINPWRGNWRWINPPIAM